MATRASLARGGTGQVVKEVFVGRVRKWSKRLVPITQGVINSEVRLELLKWVQTEERTENLTQPRRPNIRAVHDSRTLAYSHTGPSQPRMGSLMQPALKPQRLGDPEAAIVTFSAAATAMAAAAAGAAGQLNQTLGSNALLPFPATSSEVPWQDEPAGGTAALGGLAGLGGLGGLGVLGGLSLPGAAGQQPEAFLWQDPVYGGGGL